ncbi:MAG: sigma-54-dependent Fis family transcriptional regulator [Proteobacteria bacterium]|nr:sigma-54-dependent Fis family transcriptional regulator [Pseudomonadota bacterium]
MSYSIQIERLSKSPLGNELLPRLILLALQKEEPAAFLAQLVTAVEESTPGSAISTSIVQGVKGTWRVLATTQTLDSIPEEMLSEALDKETYQSDRSWCATLLKSNHLPGQLLIQQANPLTDHVAWDSIAAAVELAQAVFLQYREPARRVERLGAMLEMTAHWNRSRETDKLLEEIAKASTRLLNAERATIFLLNSDRQTLVGKPALGVEGGELIIPSNAGVVGEVIQTGEPRRVDSDIASEQRQIHRSVDEQLDFETHSLLCVPLINSANQTIGAFELINKTGGNFSDSDQAALIDLAAQSAVAIENTQLVENLESKRRIVADEAAGQVQLVGTCLKIQQLKQTIERIADTDLAILITGENGTGKEVVAQMIHYLSARRDEVLVAVNCAAITESLLESELFGHEKGAFTDAHQSRAGKFELADNGTLFLDEIGDMSLGGQAKLLRVLEEKVVVRVGGSQSIPTRARVVAATNQKLAKLVEGKQFREDLFFRLNVVTIEIPPLRDRGDDIHLLAQHFLKEFCQKARRSVPKISAEAKARLLRHPWPGNVRELRNLMERLAYLSSGDTIDVEDLAFVGSPRSTEPVVPLNLALTEATRLFQSDYIQKQIQNAQGNMTEAASILGLHRSNLYRKMRQLEMDLDDSAND